MLPIPARQQRTSSDTAANLTVTGGTDATISLATL